MPSVAPSVSGQPGVHGEICPVVFGRVREKKWGNLGVDRALHSGIGYFGCDLVWRLVVEVGPEAVEEWKSH